MSLMIKYFSDVCNPHFIDSHNVTCQDYADKKLCSPFGGFGRGWFALWGTFEHFEKDGENAEVCPQCGCGSI